MANGRMYSVALDHISVTNDSDQDILEFVNGSAAAMVLHSITLTSAYSTDERVRLRILRRTTTGSGGSAATENPLDGLNTVAANCAVSYLVTTPGTGGAVLDAAEWPQIHPWQWFPSPACQILVPVSGRLALHLGTAVGTTRSWSVTTVWEEL